MCALIRSHFDRRLAHLNDSVLELGNGARQAVLDGMRALLTNDAELARETIGNDAQLNRLRFDIEKDCYFLLATEQPVAGDLRRIVSALTVTGDLERIGDHGKKIARTALRMLEDPRPIPMDNLTRLSELASALVDRALQAYATNDVPEAEAVCQADDQVDAYYKQSFNLVIAAMLENPRLIGSGTQLLQVAHELERVGDRATNVAERVIYTVTGELNELNL
jgi:phosphate transport system protein